MFRLWLGLTMCVVCSSVVGGVYGMGVSRRGGVLRLL